MLHLALHLAYLILQLSARALEGIVESVVDVRITLVVLRGAADMRSRKRDLDLDWPSV